MFEEINLLKTGNNARVVNGHQQDQSVQIIQNKQLVNFVDSISQMVLVLNKHQQIVYPNKSYRDFFKSPDPEYVIGKNPGNSFKCKNVLHAKHGCGTTKFCGSCGAAKAIEEALAGTRSTRECKILTSENETIDLRVTANPFKVDNEELILFSIIDISHEKRRKSLERILIHDVMNIAGGISGLSAIFKEIDDPDEMREIAATIENASRNLIEEIQVQRELASAESGDLKVYYNEIQTLEILNDLKKLYSSHGLNSGKPIIIPQIENYAIVTDPALLKRILGNMVKNAVEAIYPNDEIELTCIGFGQKVRFEVRNRSIIPEAVQAEIFKLFFSTKQNGRGIGTYLMKLLGEKYLKGKVWFSSTSGKGTSFYFELNR